MTPDSPLRVGIVTTAFLPLFGGAEKQCLSLARSLHKRGCLAWILTQHLAPESPRTEAIDGMSVHRVGVVALWRKLFRSSGRAPEANAVTGYERALQRGRLAHFLYYLKSSLGQLLMAFSVVALISRSRRSVGALLCFSLSPLEAIACRLSSLFGIPVIVRSSNSRRYLFIDLLARWQRESLIQASRVVALSHDIRLQLLASGVEDSRIRVIPNGVDLPSAQWDRNVAHPYAAICVANLVQQPLKGLDVLVEAWTLVTSQVGPRRLLVCGRGNAAPLMALARSRGVGEHIDFAGFVDDVTAKLLAAEVFVLPSRFEGMSNALLEAMALGMPCVATSVSGSVDLIDTGRNGVLVPPEDAEALATAVLSVLGDNSARARLGVEARRTIEAGYTTELMIKRYEAVLTELDPRFFNLG